jgi:hypothetical protein
VENFRESKAASPDEAAKTHLSEQILDLMQPPLLMAIRDADRAQPLLASNAAEKVIDIKQVGWKIGWWQQQEYEKIGVQKIQLGQGSVALELNAPYKKTQFFTTMEMDKNFSFKFDPAAKNWAVTDVKGLKLEGETVKKIETDPTKIVFTTNKGKQEYPAGVGGYIRALFDPLMRSDLRK